MTAERTLNTHPASWRRAPAAIGASCAILVVAAAVLLASGCSSPGGNGSGGPMRAAVAAGLAFSVPEGWTEVDPASAMRSAQFALPPASEGGDAPELILFHFGAGQGGDVQANIERWIGQISQPDGKPSTERARRASREVGKFRVSTVMVDGTYASGSMMGMMGTPHGDPHGSPHEGGAQKEDYRLWAAVVEGEGGPWFFKCAGPRAALEKAAGGLEAMVGSIRPGEAQN